jgi:hypothetical protein
MYTQQLEIKLHIVYNNSTKSFWVTNPADTAIICILYLAVWSKSQIGNQ